MKSLCIAVRPAPDEPVAGEDLAAALGLPLCHAPVNGDPPLLLEFDRDGALTLRDTTHKTLKPLRVDLALRFRGRGHDPLLRALGPRSDTVVDCNAGLGSDTAHLAASGKTVQALEIHPVIHALLADALARCHQPDINRNMRLECADAVAWLERSKARPDVIYLDPMYPPAAGTAAPRKNARILRMLAGYDPDADHRLLEVALRHARYRVVVKRPHHAPPILPGKRGETRGKLVRFDIYTPGP